MARGYSSQDDNYVPSRPARRVDSRRVPASPPPPPAEDDEGGMTNFGYTQYPPPPSSRPPAPSSSSYAGGHYAESPILMPAGSERTLAIVNSHHNHPTATGTLRSQHRTRADSGGRDVAHQGHGHHGSRPTSRQSLNGTRRSRSRPNSRPPSAGGMTVSKVIRSRSLSSRPAGVSVYHPPGSSRAGASTAHSHHSGPYPVYQYQGGPPSSRPATRMSSKSGRSAPGKSTKAGVVIETMSAPNPFCPNTKGVCCLMVLVNLALILVAIGFIIVLQLPTPEIVWNFGIFILIFGFLTFLVALIYCMCICQESSDPRNGRPPQGELYWTHHWQKNITIPEIKSRDKERWEEQDRFPEDDDDVRVDVGVDDLSDTSSRDYPRLYLESDYGQRTDREADFETEQEGHGHGHGHGHGAKSEARGSRYASADEREDHRGRH